MQTSAAAFAKPLPPLNHGNVFDRNVKGVEWNSDDRGVIF